MSWVVTRNTLPNEPYLLHSSTDEGRPFHYQMEFAKNGEWESCAAMSSTLSRPAPPSTAFLKFRGAELGCTAPLWTYGGNSLAAQALEGLRSHSALLASRNDLPPISSAVFAHWLLRNGGVLVWLVFWLLLLTMLTIVACYWDSILPGLQQRGLFLSLASNQSNEEATGPRGNVKPNLK